MCRFIECYDVRLVDVFDAEEVTGGKRVFVARSEAMLYIVPQLRKS
jgi:hypothetical protein